LLAAACGAATGDRSGAKSNENLQEGNAGARGFDNAADSGGLKLDQAAVDEAQDLRGSECASLSQTAKNKLRPADVIMAIDNGPSMQENIDAVRANLNAFSQKIVDSGVDTRIVLLSAALDPDAVSMATVLGGSSGGWRAICIDAPLGSGNCPDDSNAPNFLHVDEEVGLGHTVPFTPERHPLNLYVQSYDKYRAAMRPQASKTFFVISDQDATVAPNGTADDFIRNMTAVDPLMFPSFTFSAVVAYQPCPGGLVGPVTGTVFLDLVKKTGGVQADICGADWGPVLDSIAESVVDTTGIDCFWDIPAVPDGETFDAKKVNVVLTSDLGEESIGQVPNKDGCDNVKAGWYYDDPSAPKRLYACDKSCEHINSAPGASIDVLFGCETKVAAPE
jgi:hypothetical protein